MSTIIHESNVYTQLRDRAEAVLEAGTTPATSHWSMGVDALRLLHRLSSDPESATDALELLHELQVHQVELDLQNEEIAANEEKLVEDLRLYRDLYDRAPFGYFIIDAAGTIIQGNIAAADLFGVTQDEIRGQRIDTFLPPENRSPLLGMLQRVVENGVKGSCMTKTGTGPSACKQFQFLASCSPRTDYILLACCECVST